MLFKKSSNFLFLAASVALAITGCSKQQSSITGWDYNNPDNGGFEVVDYEGQETGPGLVFIEGGTFTMGNTEADVMYEWHAVPKRTTVSSFYMDETEIANIHYNEYLWWLGRTFGADYPEVVKRATPDKRVWRDELAYNEPLVKYYFEHPAYNMYPVVGVSWVQATDFCKWRTDRVNEQVMVNQGILEDNPNQINEDNFNTDAYLLGQYEGLVKNPIEDIDPNGSGERIARISDGILMPDYRLPTEAEWEFAALGLVGNLAFKDEERYEEQRIYPWNGTSSRFPNGASTQQGDFLANFQRGRGDLMGVSGNQNDGADITAPVDHFMPNDFGLYNMSGNVSEWVMDVYRSMTSVDANDFRGFRGNDYKTLELNSDGTPTEKDSLGRMTYRSETADDLVGRRNYKRGNVKNFEDGDEDEWYGYRDYQNPDYAEKPSTMVNDRARVYKGGSWRDRAYWISPGARRFLDEQQATDDIGFRCAMTRLGSPGGNADPAGNTFGKRRR